MEATGSVDDSEVKKDDKLNVSGAHHVADQDANTFYSIENN